MSNTTTKITNNPPATSTQAPKTNISMPILSFTDDYLTNPSGYLKDVAVFQNYTNIFTGFSNLDYQQGSIYPGLYILGAASSLGKTTFFNHLSDNLAKDGHHILYFALEQSPFQLNTKSIAKELYLARKNTNDPSIPLYTAIELQKGQGANDINVTKVINNYIASIGHRKCIISSMFSLTLENIEFYVDKYIKYTGVCPVVIIDYLQIVQSSIDSNGRQMDTRTAIDHIVHGLKVYQNQNDMIIMVISSLNRQNYLSELDFESFKESGGIEYTADVVWGLQPNAIHTSELFKKEGHINEKRDLIKKARRADPRKIELVCLKNRFGISNYTCHFDYYASSDCFVSL